LPPSAPPFRPPSPPSSYEFDITLLFGVLLALVAASGIGMAMVIQRHGLIHGNCRTWFMGLVLYGISNGLQAASLTLGPLFLLGGVFTLLLVFNLVFARIILREEATIFKLSGAVVMIGGVAMSVNAAPDAQTEFSGQEIDARASSFKGAFWLIFLTLMLFASIAAMVMFERQYPAALSVSPAEAGHHSPRTPRLPVVDSHSPSPYLPSRRLNNCMAVVYPVSLGLDEGWAQLSLRTWLVMVTNSSENNATVDHWAFYTFSFIWVISSLATVPYMRVVFRRYALQRLSTAFIYSMPLGASLGRPCAGTRQLWLSPSSMAPFLWPILARGSFSLTRLKRWQTGSWRMCWSAPSLFWGGW